MPAQAPPGQLEEAFTGDSKKYLPFGLLQSISLLGGCFPRLLELYFCAPASAQSCLKWRSPTVPDSHVLSAKRAGAPHPWHPTIDLDPPTIKRCHSCVTGIWGRKISSLTNVIFRIIDCISSSYIDKLYILVVFLPRFLLLKSKEIGAKSTCRTYEWSILLLM